MWAPNREVTHDCLIALFTTGLHTEGVVGNKWPCLHRVFGLTHEFVKWQLKPRCFTNIETGVALDIDTPAGSVPIMGCADPVKFARNYREAAMQDLLDTLNRALDRPLSFSPRIKANERNTTQIRRVIQMVQAVDVETRLSEGDLIPRFIWWVQGNKWSVVPGDRIGTLSFECRELPKPFVPKNQLKLKGVK